MVSLSPAALEALTQFADPANDAWLQAGGERGVMGEVRGLLNNYLAHLLGHRPTMHAYLRASG